MRRGRFLTDQGAWYAMQTGIVTVFGPECLVVRGRHVTWTLPLHALTVIGLPRKLDGGSRATINFGAWPTDDGEVVKGYVWEDK